MSLIIYINKDDTWIEKVKEYAEFNSWSLSKAIRQILKAFVQVNMMETEDIKKVTEIVNGEIVQNWIPSVVSAYNELTKEQIEEIKKVEIPEPPKIDLATFEAQNMAKIMPKDTDVENCDRRTVDKIGIYSCWFFDQGRAYYPFCIEKCWTNKDIWGKRVRL